MDLSALLNAKRAWQCFKENHPKVPSFLSAVSARGIPEGTVLELQVKYPSGETMKTNLQVKPSDLELLQLLDEVRKTQL